MNERLKQLAFKAYNNAGQGTPDALSSFMEVYSEKFAELIVRECGYYADIFEAVGCPVDMDPTETKPSDYIKQHFGVEE